MGESNSKHRPRPHGLSSSFVPSRADVVTTAKSQATAVCCAGIVRPPPRRRSRSSHGSACAPAPSMVVWAQSSALFRAWAQEWVLRPATDAVFRLPFLGGTGGTYGVEHYLHVSVSPTLGFVSHGCFISRGAAGCVGPGMVLCKRQRHDAGEHYYVKNLASLLDDDGDYAELPGFRVECGCGWVMCNRRWIVVLETGDSALLRVWKVAAASSSSSSSSSSDCGAVVGVDPELWQDDGIEPGRVEFSPLCDDVVIVLRENENTPEAQSSVTFIDLAESFRTREVVVTLKVACGDQWPCLRGVFWMPDGSLATLNLHKSEPCCTYLVERNPTPSGGTGKHYRFPQLSEVTPIGRSHAFVTVGDHRFEVYNTGNYLAAPSLCIPCSWACTSKQPCGLIAYTTHQKDKELDNSGEWQFSVRDGVTGFHVGDFTVGPLDLSFVYNTEPF